MTVMESQTLKLSSSSEQLTTVETIINELCEEHKVTEDRYGNILVAVTEAVNNAIQHGNKYNPEKNIGISYLSEEGKLCFRVQDEGEGFDFDNLPDPTDPVNLEKPHGRGVFLMKHLADNVEFFENGSIVELNFKLS